MVSKISIRVFGITKATRFLNNKKNQISINSSKNIEKAALLLAKEIKDSIAGNRAEPRSVDTGQFLSSIQSQKISNDKSRVFSDVGHSVFLEFGTSRIRERRHFRNSVERKKEEIRKTIQADLL